MNFTYKTMTNYFKDMMSGYIESYQTVRISTTTIDGNMSDYPVHSQEEFQKHLTMILNNPNIIGIGIEQTTHSYDIQDYID